MVLQTSQVAKIAVILILKGDNNMNNIEKLIDDLHLETNLSGKDIPDIDLYMDQVIQLFENKFAPTKRSAEEKILTKTMINNYSKGKLFFPIKNKKYSREHMMLINMIYEMKTVLSIRDIKHTLEKLNLEITNNDFSIEKLYDNYLEVSEFNAGNFKDNSKQISNKVEEEIAKQEEVDIDYLEKLLLTLSFVNMSNYYRRAAEKMVDQIEGIELKRD